MNLFQDFMQLTDAKTGEKVFVRRNSVIMFERHPEGGTLVWVSNRDSTPRLVKECLKTIYDKVE
jgi:hypothetical protein